MNSIIAYIHIWSGTCPLFFLTGHQWTTYFYNASDLFAKSGFLRTDEAWMVEKKDGGSHMYSLNDFKIHNTINIENGYMEGRYGAIPFIGELNM